MALLIPQGEMKRRRREMRRGKSEIKGKKRKRREWRRKGDTEVMGDRTDKERDDTAGRRRKKKKERKRRRPLTPNLSQVLFL